jgi:GDP-L-fucose synthase
MTILVAGSSGLVGSAIVNKLNLLNRKVIGVSSKDLDLRDRENTIRTIEEIKPKVIIDAAARVGGLNYNSSNPVDFLVDNLRIQNNLMEAAYISEVEKFIFLGSSCIYPKNSLQPIKEEYLMTGKLESTNSAYAVAKLSGIELIKAYRHQYRKPWINIIPTSVYGPRDNFNISTSHVIPALIKKFENAVKNNLKEVILLGTGLPKREFIHSEDLADAILLCLERYDSDEPINIGTGYEISINDLANLISLTVGFTGDIKWDHNWPDGTPRKLVDSTKINDLGWKPNISLESGLKSTINWYSQTLGT